MILHEIHAKRMMLNETFQVVAIIEKLPHAWKDFKNKQKEMSVRDLIVRLRIKENNKGSKKKLTHNSSKAKTNFVKHGQSSKFKKANNKRKDAKVAFVF